MQAHDLLLMSECCSHFMDGAFCEQHLSMFCSQTSLALVTVPVDQCIISARSFMASTPPAAAPQRDLGSHPSTVQIILTESVNSKNLIQLDLNPRDLQYLNSLNFFPDLEYVNFFTPYTPFQDITHLM